MVHVILKSTIRHRKPILFPFLSVLIWRHSTGVKQKRTWDYILQARRQVVTRAEMKMNQLNPGTLIPKSVLGKRSVVLFF